MRNTRRLLPLALPLGLFAACHNPNVRPDPVPTIEMLRAEDCPPAITTYQRLLALPPRAGMVMTARGPIRSEAEQASTAQTFATQCQTSMVGKTRRAILRCWLDSADSENFQSCSQRF